MEAREPTRSSGWPAWSRERACSRISGIILGFCAVSGALALVLLNLFRGKIPAAFWRGWKPTLEGLAAVLQKTQTGHVGDYIVWLVIGAVAMGASLILARLT